MRRSSRPRTPAAACPAARLGPARLLIEGLLLPGRGLSAQSCRVLREFVASARDLPLPLTWATPARTPTGRKSRRAAQRHERGSTVERAGVLNGHIGWKERHRCSPREIRSLFVCLVDPRIE